MNKLLINNLEEFIQLSNLKQLSVILSGINSDLDEYTYADCKKIITLLSSRLHQLTS